MERGLKKRDADQKMAEQTRKITLYFFLFALFIFLAFFIGSRIYLIYTESKSTSLQTTKSVLDCTFNFYLRNMQYDGNILLFDLETSDEKLLNNLTIESGGQVRDIELGRFVLYTQRVRIEGITIEDQFFVFPTGCEELNKKECFISTANCRDVKAAGGYG